jgi:hypothetical protein
MQFRLSFFLQILSMIPIFSTHFFPAFFHFANVKNK